MRPAGVSPLLVLRSRFAVSPCLGCAVFLSRAAADDIYVIGRVLSSNLTFPLECYPATPTRPPQRPSSLMGFTSLQHLRNSRSTLRGLAGPLRSAFRVWLPSWRLAPSNPAPVLFHTGGAPGIHPSEVSSPARFRQSFDWEEPTYRWPSGFSAAEASDRPDGPRFLGSRLPGLPCGRAAF